MLINKYLRNADFYDSISVVIKLILLFTIGVGNYRAIIALIVYFSARALVCNKAINISLNLLTAPLVVFAILYDVKYGQLWSSHEYNLFYLIVAFIVIDHVSTKYINMLTEHISNNYIFSYCLNCKYENNGLTASCKNCGHEGGSVDVPLVRNEIYDDSFKSQLPTLRYAIDNYSIANLSLTIDEKIYMSIKIGFGDGPRISGKKQLCTNVVITNRNIILMHKFIFQRGWRWREKISLNDIKEVVMVDQNITSSARQSIKLSTESSTYELFLWTLYKQKKEFHKYYDAINNHIIKMQSA